MGVQRQLGVQAMPPQEHRIHQETCNQIHGEYCCSSLAGLDEFKFFGPRLLFLIGRREIGQGVFNLRAAPRGIPFERTNVLAFFDNMARNGYPAIHHSATFRDAYRPAYRVVAIDLLQDMDLPSEGHDQ